MSVLTVRHRSLVVILTRMVLNKKLHKLLHKLLLHRKLCKEKKPKTSHSVQ